MARSRFGRRPRRRRVRLAAAWPSAGSRRRVWRALRAAPRPLQFVLALAAVAVLWFVANGLYQVARKPAELLSPLSGVLSKNPQETWRQYAPAFRAHATPVLTPNLLAALAQVEGAGNPVALTYWRWRPSWHPFELYRPASSAVGMYQITDATFREARRYCIHDHAVVEEGAWYDSESCWFNVLYSRVVPTHAIEMTSAFLSRQVTLTLERRRISGASLQQKQDLAAVIHLCGATAGDAYAGRGFRLSLRQSCGDHDVHGYIARVDAMKREFSRLAAEDAVRE
jgi:hypothetical protein